MGRGGQDACVSAPRAERLAQLGDWVVAQDELVRAQLVHGRSVRAGRRCLNGVGHAHAEQHQVSLTPSLMQNIDMGITCCGLNCKTGGRRAASWTSAANMCTELSCTARALARRHCACGRNAMHDCRTCLLQHQRTGLVDEALPVGVLAESAPHARPLGEAGVAVEVVHPV